MKTLLDDDTVAAFMLGMAAGCVLMAAVVWLTFS